MEHNKRHVIVWRICHPLVKILLWIKFNFTAKTVDLDGPYIVLSNHVTDWDPLLVGVAFKRQMYYVASEHILRMGFISKLLSWLVAPIARQKGGSAAGAVMNVIRTVRAGGNVALFPEGNRSWDGLTRAFPPSTAKLVRSCGCTLVTFRLRGGYFSSPRWAGSRTRRGRMTGEVVGIYKSEELHAMKLSEINDIIARDLYVDAYDEQRRDMVAFNGTKLAEELETLLFTCPRCGAMHKMVSSGSSFRCESCGMETRYTPTGFFEGGDLPFDDVYSWSSWQDKQLEKLIENAGDKLIFSDTDIELFEVETARGSTSLGCGAMELYADRLELPGGTTVKKEEIAGMALLGSSRLFLSTSDGRQFQLQPKSRCCTLKYLTACSMLGAAVGYGV